MNRLIWLNEPEKITFPVREPDALNHVRLFVCFLSAHGSFDDGGNDNGQ